MDEGPPTSRWQGAPQPSATLVATLSRDSARLLRMGRAPVVGEFQWYWRCAPLHGADLADGAPVLALRPIVLDHFGRSRKTVPGATVNLDALIPREDFALAGDEVAPSLSVSQTLSVGDLEGGKVLSGVLRKPDFQRETAAWGPDKVAGLVKSFVNEDLIPSIILWRSQRSGNIFVIDGAHRLSALKAWVLDDYGDKSRSIEFFADLIPDEQARAADRTRRLIEVQVGSYQSLKTAILNPDLTPPEKLRLAKQVAVGAIQVQWVTGDASKAEQSFLTINQEAAYIDKTELAMLKARRKPNALATRAFIRAGTGHKYWSTFDAKTQNQIEALAREVYNALFRPTLETPIKTTDLPVAGRGYSAGSVSMVFELVNYLNKVRADSVDAIPDDEDGSATIRFMREVKKAAQLISGQYPGSLGLSPVVYFYSATGRFQPTAFLAAIAFARELADKKRLNKFTGGRSRFEDFLVQHRNFINQVVRKYGSSRRGLEPLLNLYRLVYEGIAADGTDDHIVATLKEHPQLSFLSDESEVPTTGARFSNETKSSAYLRQAIESELRCGICHARLHTKSISIDHKERQEDGGLGSADNAQLSHPYCNSGYKESEVSRARAASKANRQS